MSRQKRIGTVGQGHSSNSILPVIRQVLPENMSPVQRQLLTLLQPGTRVYRMGRARIYLSPPNGVLGWHLSISCQDRYPTWDEVAKAWYDLVPESETRTAVLFLPPKSEYINIHEFCLQVQELIRAPEPG